LAALFTLGYIEEVLNVKLLLSSYEVTGASVEEISAEVNQILEGHHRLMQNISTGKHGVPHPLQFRCRRSLSRAKGIAAPVEGVHCPGQRHFAGPGGARVSQSLRTIPFVKASACGNDFLLIDGALAPADMAAFSRRICDRREGVGADGRRVDVFP